MISFCEILCQIVMVCFLIIHSGVSVSTSAWGLCVYSISGGLIVLTGCISKSGCFSDNCCKAVCAGVNGGHCAGKREYFLSLNWIYSLIIHSGVSVSTSAWGLCVYSNSGGLMVPFDNIILLPNLQT